MDWIWILVLLAGAALAGGVLRWARHDYREDYDVDVLVVGGGAAGLTASGMAARLGASTVLVESERLGGDCTWYGCVPSKALLAAASVAHQARTADAHGLGTAELEVDLSAVLARVHELQDEIYEEADSPEVLEGFGVRVRAGACPLRRSPSCHHHP